MSDILQTQLPYDLVAQRPLPGIAPLDLADWIHVDEAFAAQMQARQTLIAKARDKVIALTDEGTAAATELLDLVLLQLSQRKDYQCASDKVTRPDGVEVAIDRLDPLGTLGILVQEDLCIMKKQGDEHALVGAVVVDPVKAEGRVELGPVGGGKETVGKEPAGGIDDEDLELRL